jgi:hypothetical protein
MPSKKHTQTRLYTRYPLSSLLIYNTATILHFLLGGAGIMLGYAFAAWPAYLAGGLYLLFAFAEMYLLMPLRVCRHCVYYRLEGSRCISGLNVLSRRIAGPGRPKDFAGRAQGLLCSNNLYMAALVLPILVILPALALNFSVLLLGICLALLGLLLFRFFVLFLKIACLHCRAKYQCPQAESMGVRSM